MVTKHVKVAGPDAHLAALREGIARLNFEAAESVLDAKAEHTMRQWLSRAARDLDGVDAMRAAALALALAADLETFTPSHTGATAFDRLARRRKLDAGEEAAIRALKGARFTPFVLRAARGKGRFSAHDLATARDFEMFDPSLSPDALGATLVGRLCALDDATVCTAGVVTPLDDAALAVAMDFVRPGRGIANGARCAAAVYRYVVRHGGPTVAGLNDLGALGIVVDDEDEPGPTALDRLVKGLMRDGTVLDPTRDALDEARRLASAGAVLEALFKAVSAPRAGEPRIGMVYRRFAEAMIEALHLRSLAGSGTHSAPLDELAGIIASEVAGNGYPRGAADLFHDIRRASAAAQPKRDGEDLTRVIERIRALRAKTVDQGCTEEEALAAADKVAELLDRYGLSLGETDLRGQNCRGVGIGSTRRRPGALDDVLPEISRFCDCRSWQERADDGTIRSMLFGLPADVEAAQYLFERVSTAVETETAAFQKAPLYRGSPSERRRKATTSFQFGLVRGIGAKLAARKAERDAGAFAASGRDLVPVKASVVEEELAKLGLSFTTRDGGRGRLVQLDAFEAGKIASGRFEIQSELE